MRAAPALPLTVLLPLLMLSAYTHAAVLSSSRLESCVRDGSAEPDTAEDEESGGGLACDEKLILAVTVGGGQALATEELQLDLRCIGSPNGQCPCPCNYQEDAGCSCRDIETPIKIWLTKSPVFASYPLEYIQSFNSKPLEVIVRPDDNQCTADAYDDDPTCGWFYVDGEQQEDSQGFSCVCSSQQVWDHTFSGSNKRTRASLNCDFFESPFDILIGNNPCSAHCLTFDPLWYSGYRIGSSQLQFQITAHISVEPPPSNSTDGSPSVDGSSFPNEQLTLSPSVPVAVSESRLASMRLLGDLATYQQTTVLSPYLLLIPQPEGANLADIKGSDRKDWLLLDRSHVSADGSECNKVGTSFEAFRYQTDGCFRAPQACLQNQIRDLIEEDRKRIKEGKVPRHLVTRYTYGAESTLDSFEGGPLTFAVPVSSESTSLVTISASADSVQLVTNRSPGEISSIRLCTFQEERCGGFEAGASRGYIWANLTNTGRISAAYTLTVSNCSANIRPVEAREVALSPGKPTVVRPPPEIFVEDNQADPDRHCWVDLYDSQGIVTDSRRLGFYTNSTEFDDKPQGGFEGKGDGPGEGAKREVDCDEACGSKFDAACFVANGCWSHFGSFLGILAGIGVGLALLGVLAKTGALTSMVSTLAKCCCTAAAARGQKEKRGSKKEGLHTKGSGYMDGFQAATSMATRKAHTLPPRPSDTWRPAAAHHSNTSPFAPLPHQKHALPSPELNPWPQPQMYSLPVPPYGPYPHKPSLPPAPHLPYAPLPSLAAPETAASAATSSLALPAPDVPLPLEYPAPVLASGHPRSHQLTPPAPALASAPHLDQARQPGTPRVTGVHTGAHMAADWYSSSPHQPSFRYRPTPPLHRSPSPRARSVSPTPRAASHKELIKEQAGGSSSRWQWQQQQQQQQRQQQQGDRFNTPWSPPQQAREHNAQAAEPWPWSAQPHPLNAGTWRDGGGGKASGGRPMRSGRGASRGVESWHGSGVESVGGGAEGWERGSTNASPGRGTNASPGSGTNASPGSGTNASLGHGRGCVPSWPLSHLAARPQHRPGLLAREQREAHKAGGTRREEGKGKRQRVELPEEGMQSNPLFDR